MSPARPTVLLVDADPGVVEQMRGALGGMFDCLAATETGEALHLLAEHFVQVVLCDTALCLPAGLPLLAEIRRRWPETARLHLRRDASLPAPETDPDGGLDHLLTLPCPDDQLRSETATAARLFQLARENERLALEMRVKDGPPRKAPASARMAGALPADAAGFDRVLRAPGSPMGAVIEAARQVATFDVPVLIDGEPGTGKRLLAEAMHAVSLRSDRPFLALDCGGLSDTVLMLELFGARNGSVPNGQRTRIGLLQKADRGTLYLGRIEELPQVAQLALLRVLQEGVGLPVGGHEPVPMRPRLICSTSADLDAIVARGGFCGDLFYTLGTARLSLPPLRARPGDIGLLAHALLFETAETHGKQVFGLEDETLAFLRAHPWPGNMRELRAEITRMLIFAQAETLGPELLGRHILQQSRDGAAGCVAAPDSLGGIEELMRRDGALRDRIEAIEARILRETLTRLKWNKSRAAAELGLSRVGLRAKLDRYGVARPVPQPEEG